MGRLVISYEANLLALGCYSLIIDFAMATAAIPARLFVPHSARLVAVPVASIRWAEAAGDYCTLHTSTG